MATFLIKYPGKAGRSHIVPSIIEQTYPAGTPLKKLNGDTGRILWWLDATHARVLWDGPTDHPHESTMDRVQLHLVRDFASRAERNGVPIAELWGRLVRDFNDAFEEVARAFSLGYNYKDKR